MAVIFHCEPTKVGVAISPLYVIAKRTKSAVAISLLPCFQNLPCTFQNMYKCAKNGVKVLRFCAVFAIIKAL